MVRPRANTLLVRLLGAYLLPTLLLLGVFGWLAVRVTRRSLDEALGDQLVGVAQAAALQLLPEAMTFLVPGDDESRTAKRLRHKLRELRDRTGLARIVTLDRKLRSLVDTEPAVRIGDRYYYAEADRTELDRVFAGQTASSVLFSGAGGRYYKTGYAPIRDGEQVVAALGVQGSAAFFRDLEQLQAYLLAAGGVIAALVVLLSVLVARRITRPLRALAGEAARIGEGDLERPIPATSRDEVGLLAVTMNDMRAALHVRDQELQLMLSGIAHEVRNPLGGIALFAGLLREELAGNAEQLEMVARIEREMGYLKNVVGEFLDYARRTPLELVPLELGELVADVAQMLAADAAAAQVTLLVEQQPACAVGDAEHLRRVLLNLARNALQATPAGRRVWLRAGTGEDGPFFAVEDEGPGIPEEHRARIFVPFFTTREKGTGLGLALSKKIVEEHGGRIELATGSAGTRFGVILRPATDAQP